MGADDSQAFLFAREMFDINFIQNFFLDDYKIAIFFYRWFWILIDYLVLLATPSYGEYIITLLPTFCLSFSLYVIYKLSRFNKLSPNSSIFLVICIFFGSSFIAFFSGMSIEAIAILFISLFIYFDQTKKNKTITFIWVFLLAAIKIFFVIPIFFYLVAEKGLNLKKIHKDYFILLISIIPIIIITAAGYNYGPINSIKSAFDFDSFLNNYLLIFFSFGSGLIFTYSFFFIILFFSNDYKKILIKFFSLLIISILLAGITYWHGQFPGNRFLAPCFVIFFPEIIKTYSYLIKSKSKFLFFFLLLIFFHLPILDYKNTSMHEYINATVVTQKPAGFSDKDQNFFPYNSIEFNPIFFSNKILINKITNSPIVTISDYKIKRTNIYPGTIGSRILFIKKYDLNYENKLLLKLKKIPDIFLLLIVILPYILIIFISLITYRSLFSNDNK